ncbi:DNA Methyltransferase [Staphylococcus piscifermentans]|uniref:Cytosine-specific methyltransferase n=1 Tax=Staphylococcus piscifermentans TaxID=70258 RepID=A0A239TFM9_9STAP|nr:DNA (cytosine-5-)-methyltransferase [Staphylococcus piscifermentans]RTX83348.1 DNA (cytosine-5-)-methyltransferase [Staphylococcus piscifermentans]GEP85080.1 cytosine-specific methyltransferase [Staphylococcus piscifermentans]SNU95623.1 DNA Methyltransferase [Staphylococcus piscifermentans]
MNYVELFAGAGGLSLGFEQAGFQNVFSVEYDEKIAQTYLLNFPDNHLIIDDVKNIDENQINKLIDGKDIDVIIGGPPCQGFSMAGRNGRSFIEDDRNELFKEFVRFVAVIKPKMFVMENVARMLSHNKGKTVLEITEAFEKLGYNVKFKVLKTENYGIPQKRQRIFFVGTKGKEFTFPDIFEKEVTVKEAIQDLPPLKSGEKSAIPNHFAMKHSQQMLDKMAYISDGGNREEIPIELRPKSGDIRKYIRYNSNKPSITVTGDMRKVFHYNQNRALTSRELARLQSFPDSFVFKGSSIVVQQQIGNAVPPKLSFVVANEVKKSLE